MRFRAVRSHLKRTPMTADTDAARHRFGLDGTLAPVVVVGRHDPHAQLPEPPAARERAPRTREPLDALLLNIHAATDRAA
jgi:hypothetical protein